MVILCERFFNLNKLEFFIILLCWHIIVYEMIHSRRGLQLMLENLSSNYSVVKTK